MLGLLVVVFRLNLSYYNGEVFYGFHFKRRHTMSHKTSVQAFVLILILLTAFEAREAPRHHLSVAVRMLSSRVIGYPRSPIVAV